MNPLDNLSVGKIILIVGAAGARKDFASGWLGLCDNFVRLNWRIDPLIGYSRIDSVGHDISAVVDSIERGDLHIDPTVNQRLAITCHIDDSLGVNTADVSTVNKLAKLVNSNVLTIAGIDLHKADMVQYHWDRLVKVHACIGMEYNNHYRQQNPDSVSNVFHISDLVTDEYAINHIENRINLAIENRSLPPREQDNHWSLYKKLDSLLPLDLDYAELFKPGGSYYLCNVVGATAPERAHAYWDAMLPFINAPDSCTAFGREWNKSMIVK
jgi:hypothetical protein